jgi:hypothetical protein
MNQNEGEGAEEFRDLKFVFPVSPPQIPYPAFQENPPKVTREQRTSLRQPPGTNAKSRKFSCIVPVGGEFEVETGPH